MPSPFIDLKNKRFEKLLVVEYAGVREKWGRTERVWKCLCDCSEYTEASTRELNKSRKQSCGCLVYDKRKPQQHYEYKDDYVVMDTYNGESFYLDKDDLEEVKLKTWWVHKSSGYICTKHYDKMLQIHRYILNPPEGKVVDHINGNKRDNRRCNLRICDHRQNSWNMKLAKNNKSGVTGVYWDDLSNKWRVEIQGKYIGIFSNKDEAIEARKLAEHEFYGEYRKREGYIPSPEDQ